MELEADPTTLRIVKKEGKAMTKEKPNPPPLETREGKQMDDNIDDLGRKQDGSKQEQPGKTKPSKPLD